MAYDSLEPIGEHRLDLLFAFQSWRICNAILMAAGSKEEIPLDAFIPEWQPIPAEEVEERSAARLREKALNLVTSSFGGKPKKQDGS